MFHDAVSETLIGIQYRAFSLNLFGKNRSVGKYTCLALCMLFGISFKGEAGGRGSFANTASALKRTAESNVEPDSDGVQQTLNLNFSPEVRLKLRKALEDYARAVDPEHEQIEERRRAMNENIEKRFLSADTDGNELLDREEATAKLPQVARLFTQVDTNDDGYVSLDELKEEQVRIIERRRNAEEKLEAQRLEKLQATEASPEKRKPKQAEDTKKRTM